MKLTQPKRKSFTLIEVLIDFTIVSMVAVALLSLMISNIRSAAYAQMRLAATNLANDRMEAIRSLPYDSIGKTNPVTGQPAIVPGFDEENNIIVAGFKFHVIVDYDYVNDPYDDPVGGPDPAPYDYKKVTIRVWDPNRTAPMATLTTNIVAKAAETTSGTGVLIVKVVDGLGVLIGEDAVVTVIGVTDPSFVPRQVHTDISGSVTVPKLPPGTYNVSVTKPGFSTDTTIAVDFCSGVIDLNGATQNPVIAAQQPTSIQMQIRCLTDLKITIQDGDGNPAPPGISIHVQSTRRLCTDPKYKYDSWAATADATGLVIIPQIEHDSYHFSSSGCPVGKTCPVTVVSSSNDYDPNLCQPVNAIVVTGNTSTLITIIDIKPKHPDKDTDATLTVSGTNLIYTNLNLLGEAKLVKGSVEILGTIIGHDNGSVTVTFNLAGAANGYWDLKIRNTNNETSVQHNAIEVTGS